MGQKVHPVGFRLGITRSHLSNWFIKKQTAYSKYLFEDDFLRKELLKKYNNVGFEKIEISRRIKNHIELSLYVEKPNEFAGRKIENLRKFKDEVKKMIYDYRKSKFYRTNFCNNLTDEEKNSKIMIAINIKKYSMNNASSIADFLIELLENRFSYRSALNLLLKKKLKKTYKGIKIKISGRLNGAEIARKEWIHEGRLPLQTLNADIDYAFKKAYTIYGILGVKIWIFK